MKNIFENIDLLKNTCKDNAREIVETIENDMKMFCSKDGVKGLLNDKKLEKIKKDIKYEKDLQKLQIELIKLQNWVYENKKRVMIIFEGRDGAGKGGVIKRFIEHINPRKFKVVALGKPSEVEAGQFYFQRYFAHLPNPGEIVFFDRSWYNRAIVEPVYGFCTKEQYEKFMDQVSIIEKSLIDDGVELIKLWLDIDKETQKERFEERRNNPLKQWKISPVDEKALELWDGITHHMNEMFKRTHSDISPWVIVDSNNQKVSRLESIRYVLSLIDYEGKDKDEVCLKIDSQAVKRFGQKDKKTKL